MSLRNHLRHDRNMRDAPALYSATLPSMPAGSFIPGAARTAQGGIFDLLRADHAKARQIQAAVQSGEVGYFPALRNAILAHSYAEEKTLYAAMLQDPTMSEQTAAQIAEHQALAGLLDALSSGGMSTQQWHAHFERAMAALDDHIVGEEGRAGVPGSYFAAAAIRLSPQAQYALGQQYEQLVRKPVPRAAAIALPSYAAARYGNPRPSLRTPSGARRGSGRCWYAGCQQISGHIVWCICCPDGTCIPIPLVTSSSSSTGGRIDPGIDRLTMWVIRRAAARGKLSNAMLKVLRADIGRYVPAQPIDPARLSGMQVSSNPTDAAAGYASAYRLRSQNQPAKPRPKPIRARLEDAMWRLSGAMQVLRDDVGGWYPTSGIRGPWVEVRSGTAGVLHRGRAPTKRVAITGRRTRGGREEVRIEALRDTPPRGSVRSNPCNCGG